MKRHSGTDSRIFKPWRNQMTGLLRVKGKINISQFWPTGSSDADTTKIQVMVDGDSFSFAPDRQNFKTTHAFENAFVKGTSKRKLIDAKSRITVRLQGIDATELHYRAGPLQKKDHPEITEEKRKNYNKLNAVERRQYLAETATMALATKLKNFGGDIIDCIMWSIVDHPFEVVDTYGRFVGNIDVGSNFNTDINVWLTEQGWVYPTFYSSMENEEIEILLAAMKKAGKKNAWKYYATDLGAFDPNLIFRKPPAEPHPAKDKGPVLMPKMFRRQVAYQMEKKARIFSGAIKKFLVAKPDSLFELKDFLESGPHSATPRTLSEFVVGNTFKIKPHEVVFREKFSTVVDKNGKVIKDF
jgi:endonuclease YncB( thermonuclease family)